MADRIQARAIRRCGELLREIKPATGAHLKRGGDSPLSRKIAAKNAGLSDAQRKQALRVANVPEAEFEQAVESNTPPTLTALAERGTQHKVLVGIRPLSVAPSQCFSSISPVL